MKDLLWFFGGLSVASFIWMILWYRNYCRQKKRLLDIISYLELSESEQYYMLVSTEDEFSLLEDELSKTISALRIARELAHNERTKQADNLADIVHQLKTPLTSMSLMTQLLEENSVIGQEEYLGRMSNQLTRLEWLTSSLLTMSKLDARAIEFHKIELSFGTLVEYSSEPMEQMILERNQTLVVDGAEGSIICDSHWTTEALLNLLKNCSDHTPNGGVILLSYTITPLYNQIIVEDNGTGFDKDEIPHLFKRFYKGKNAKKNSVGIGLALSKAMIEGQDGMIRAENCERSGARFIIRFYK